MMLLLLTLINAVGIYGEVKNEKCDNKPRLDPRPHSVSILEFGVAGDG